MQDNMPILILRGYIAECAARISPAKAMELGEFSNSNGMSIEFTDDKKFSIRVNLATNTIKLPVGALTYLWGERRYWIQAATSGQTQQSTFLTGQAEI